MAIVKLSDVTVTRVNSKGFGVQVKEADRGEFKGSRFTVWFKEFHGLSQGDTVSLSGFLGAKVSEWTNDSGELKHTVELSINSPKLDGFPAQGSGNAPVPSPAEHDDFANGAGNAEVPF